jgi:DNA-binding PadR family transcriptional regulator
MNDADVRQAIVFLFTGSARERTAHEIGEELHLGPSQVYPALARLERDRQVISRWSEGSYPRRRLYRLI